MVAALFEGDLRYALTVFGKPKGLDAVIVPDGYALSPTLTLRTIVDIDFVLEPDAELFRVHRLEDEQGLTFFSLQTFARSLDSSRPGPFIGAGIFARAGIDPVAMVTALRDLLGAAQQALTANHRFTVEQIGDNEKRLLAIPSSVDAVRAAHSLWIPYVELESGKHCFVEGSVPGANTPEQFFQTALALPFAFSRNSFYSENAALIASCRTRADEFDVMSLDDVYARVERYTRDSLAERAHFQQHLIALKAQHQNELRERDMHSVAREQALNDQIKTLQAQTRVLERNVAQSPQMSAHDFVYHAPIPKLPAASKKRSWPKPRLEYRRSRIWLLSWLLAAVATIAVGISFGSRITDSLLKRFCVGVPTKSASHKVIRREPANAAEREHHQQG